MQTFFWLIMQSSPNEWQEEMCDEALRMSVWEATNQNSSFFQVQHNRVGSRIFFRRGRTRLLLYFNANKPLSFFFFCRIPVALENRRSSQGGAHPLHPPPRSPLIRSLPFVGSGGGGELGGGRRSFNDSGLLWFWSILEFSLTLRRARGRGWGVRFDLLSFSLETSKA